MISTPFVRKRLGSVFDLITEKRGLEPEWFGDNKATRMVRFLWITPSGSVGAISVDLYGKGFFIESQINFEDYRKTRLWPWTTPPLVVYTYIRNMLNQVDRVATIDLEIPDAVVGTTAEVTRVTFNQVLKCDRASKGFPATWSHEALAQRSGHSEPAYMARFVHIEQVLDTVYASLVKESGREDRPFERDGRLLQVLFTWSTPNNLCAAISVAIDDTGFLFETYLDEIQIHRSRARSTTSLRAIGRRVRKMLRELNYVNLLGLYVGLTEL